MKLFIGNVSSDATDADVMELFSEFSPIVDFHRPLHRDTGLPRKFVFVTLEDQVKGEAAITKLNGFDFFGRKLGANEADDRSGGGNPPGRKRPQRDDKIDSGNESDTHTTRRGDDRPVGADGQRVRYKGI